MEYLVRHSHYIAHIVEIRIWLSKQVYTYVPVELPLV